MPCYTANIKTTCYISLWHCLVVIGSQGNKMLNMSCDITICTLLCALGNTTDTSPTFLHRNYTL